jgi:glycosyltransferase involved in cell wall biosynthesis
MRVDAFVPCWNEEELLPFFVKHYRRFVDTITVFDNYSTDGTAEVAKNLGCDVVPFGEPGVLDERHLLDVKTHGWKRSPADYVIVCDVDEFLIAATDNLTRWFTAGVTWVGSRGFQMYSRDMPKADMLEITRGLPSREYSKHVLFSPKHITHPGYSTGCHAANPQGHVVHASNLPLLCHYHFIGGINRVVKRYAERAERRSAYNREHRYALRYTFPASILKTEFSTGIVHGMDLWNNSENRC